MSEQPTAARDHAEYVDKAELLRALRDDPGGNWIEIIHRFPAKPIESLQRETEPVPLTVEDVERTTRVFPVWIQSISEDQTNGWRLFIDQSALTITLFGVGGVTASFWKEKIGETFNLYAHEPKGDEAR